MNPAIRDAIAFLDRYATMLDEAASMRCVRNPEAEDVRGCIADLRRLNSEIFAAKELRKEQK